MSASSFRPAFFRPALMILLLGLFTLPALAQQTYTVKAGDTLFRIAQAHNLTLAQIQQLNNLRTDRIRVGQVLRVDAGPSVHVVKRGETLYRISRTYGLTVAQIRQMNNLTGDTIEVGQQLRVRDTPPPTPNTPPPTATPPPAALPAPAPDGLGRYEIRPGDTLFDIAFRYQITVDTLYALNEGLSTLLLPGQELRLPAAFATTAYTVRRGDTLSKIARQHNITVVGLRQANGLQGDRIGIGQVLQIPTRHAPPVRAEATPPPTVATGGVLVYPDTFTGRLTASGAPYAPTRFTASHPTLPLGTVVLLTNPATQRSTFAEVNDRGPVSENYLMDVSRAVAQALGLADNFGAAIEVRVMQ